MDFKTAWLSISKLVYFNAKEKGFWEKGPYENISEKFMNVVTELGEAQAGLRKGNPQSDKIPQFTNVEEELADVILLIMSISEAYGWDIPGAILAKIEYNKTRPYRHGKDF